MRELFIMFQDVLDYICGAVSKVQPFTAGVVTVINYILFPDKAYIAPAIGVAGAMIMDILTKYYALAVKNGGLWKAIKVGAIKSDSLWKGTQRKLIGYLSIMILCGLSMRMVPIAGIAVGFTTIVYSVLFLRESQSCVENLVDAGHTDFEWIIRLLKRKQKKILEEDKTEDYNDSEGSV